MARNRHAKKQTKLSWLEHRTGYPSPEEREAIIERRYELRMELITLMTRDISPNSPEGQRLSQKYGQEEVSLALKPIQKIFSNMSLLKGDGFDYRQYRQRFARFGGQRPFLSAADYYQKNNEQAKYTLDFLQNKSKHRPDTEELLDLLMIDAEIWQDITPEDIPARPASFPPPANNVYQEPLAAMLTWGPSLLPLDLLVNDWPAWEKKHIPALTRMTLDPALLHGWPGDKASWAPWYSLHMLAELQAVESAYALGELADMENDWLTDHLAHVWADMGHEVEPVLMMILDDPKLSDKRRGLAAEALKMLSENEPALQQAVVEAFERLIANRATSATLNAYLIDFLTGLIEDPADSNELIATIETAFAESRVDTTLISLEDMPWMGDDDEDWGDDDEDWDDDDEDDWDDEDWDDDDEDADGEDNKKTT